MWILISRFLHQPHTKTNLVGLQGMKPISHSRTQAASDGWWGGWAWWAGRVWGGEHEVHPPTNMTHKAPPTHTLTFGRQPHAASIGSISSRQQDGVAHGGAARWKQAHLHATHHGMQAKTIAHQASTRPGQDQHTRSDQANTRIAGRISACPSHMRDWISACPSNMRDWISASPSNMRDWISACPSNMRDWVSACPSNMSDWISVWGGKMGACLCHIMYQITCNTRA